MPQPDVRAKMSKADALLWAVEAEECRRSLKVFLERIWPIFEPREFVDGWCIDALVDHLEAVTRGDIRYLLVNIPPRHSKSSVISVAWRLWGWLQEPSAQFLSASFNLNLAIRDNVRIRRIIEDNWFQQRFGGDIILSEEQNLKSYFTNTSNGHQQVTSVGGSTTGLGGNHLVCLEGDTLVQTLIGEVPIGQIVEQRLATSVLSYHTQTGRMEYHPIVRWIRTSPSPDGLCYRVDTSVGDIVQCTGEHPFYVIYKGWTRADRLEKGDRLLTLSRSSQLHRGHFVTEVIGAEQIPPMQVVYNLEVSRNHNFYGSNVLLKNCDDPHNVDEAYSDMERGAALSWFRESWTNRMNNPAKDKMVVVGQRIHEDDISGYILRERPDWTTLILPAYYEPSRHCVTTLGLGREWSDPRREEGDLLWPQRFSRGALEGLRRDLGTTGFSSQYQQSPVPSGGGIFKEKWFRYFAVEGDNYTLFDAETNEKRHIPRAKCWKFATVDLAISSKQTADFTVVGMWAVTPDRDLLLVDLFRDHLDNPAQQRLILSVYQQYHPNFIQIETVAYQLALVQQLTKQGIPCREYKPVRDKVSRASTASVFVEQGKVYFLSGASWLADLRHELSHFPFGSHDDMVDVVSMACEQLASGTTAHDLMREMNERAAAKSRIHAPVKILVGGVEW